jgi:hypothetical protein
MIRGECLISLTQLGKLRTYEQDDDFVDFRHGWARG